MRIARAEIFEYVLPLTRPFVTARLAMTERRGLILKASSESGRVGFGEIAPLEGFSRELLSDCVEQAQSMAGKLTGSDVPKSHEEIAGLLSTNQPLPPSVAFGFELALCDLAAQESNQSIANWLRADAMSGVQVNAIITGGDVASQVAAKLDQGYTTFKIKVGSRIMNDDIGSVQEIRKLIGPTRKLRLDANQAFSTDDAMRFMSSLYSSDIEYIEEPLKSPTAADLESLRTSQNIPIAIDETLIQWCSSSTSSELELTAQQLAAFDVAIVKPALMGSIARTMRLAESLQSNGKGVIVTSALDTGIGVMAALQIACALKIKSACGLDTSAIFARPLIAPLVAASGNLQLPNTTGLGLLVGDIAFESPCLRRIDVD